MGDGSGAGHGPTAREQGGRGDRMTRARSAARHAERLYPGPLGRLVADELTTYAATGTTESAGLVDGVITEVLDRTPRRATG